METLAFFPSSASSIAYIFVCRVRWGGPLSSALWCITHHGVTSAVRLEAKVGESEFCAARLLYIDRFRIHTLWQWYCTYADIEDSFYRIKKKRVAPLTYSVFLEGVVCECECNQPFFYSPGLHTASLLGIMSRLGNRRIKNVLSSSLKLLWSALTETGSRTQTWHLNRYSNKTSAV